MASLVLSGDTSGSITVSAPAVAGSTTQTLVNVTGTLAPIVSGTAVTCAGQTSIDFTGIPSWAKRITVMFSGVSTNGTSNILVQIGSGSFTTSGYASGAWSANTSNAGSTAGFILTGDTTAAESHSGAATIVLVTGFQYISSGSIGQSVTPSSNGGASASGGTVTLSGALDRVRITTVNGTDTFDTTPSAGTINLLWE
jgi:hypothetical protein